MSIRPLKSLLKDQQLLRTCAYIGGEWICNAKEVFDVLNPVDGSLVSTVARSRDSDVDTAIEHADSVGKTWSKTLASERAVILNNWYDLVMENQEDLAQIMTAECGKPLAESRGEIVYAASFLKWFAEEGKRAYGDIIPEVDTARGSS